MTAGLRVIGSGRSPLLQPNWHGQGCFVSDGVAAVARGTRIRNPAAAVLGWSGVGPLFAYV